VSENEPEQQQKP